MGKSRAAKKRKSKKKVLALEYKGDSSDVHIFYHGGCPDGSLAAWIARRYYRTQNVSISLHAEKQHFLKKSDTARYHDKVVVIADLCVDREALVLLYAVAKNVVVLDHHDSSREEYKGLVFAQWDDQRCAAVQAWDHFYPGTKRPWMVSYVDDMDRWQQTQPDTKAVQMHLRKLHSPFAIDEFLKKWVGKTEEMIEEGKKLLKVSEKLLAEKMEKAHPAMFGDVEVIAVNARGNRSELGMALSERHGKIAVVWWSHFGGHYTYSFRSARDLPLDTEELASQYGGGGHYHASACRSDVQLLTDEDGVKLPEPTRHYTTWFDGDDYMGSGYVGRGKTVYSGSGFSTSRGYTPSRAWQKFNEHGDSYPKYTGGNDDKWPNEEWSGYEDMYPEQAQASRKAAIWTERKNGAVPPRRMRACPDCGRYQLPGDGKWRLEKHKCQPKNGSRQMRNDSFDLIEDEDGYLVPVRYEPDGRITKL
jgi:oligoribonuclease NrnB/cAMP/cGMP phosphodiesterase (DHH superfamily)